MKINRIPSSKLINQYIHVREKTQEALKKDQGSDKVELTKDSKTFSAALSKVKKSMTTRAPSEMKRIDEVSKMVKNDTYSVKGEDVANILLGD
ncbi:MAG: flagellar biosynthesis anti-sigma factor FlgM [Clostridiales bacterium]|nr:flagellar biosynthesis anti-sigma factor FlgM [Clostridiales bacterium]